MFLSDPPESPDAAKLQQDDRDESGYVWNLTRLWSWRPDVLQDMTALRTRLVNGSGLSMRDLGVIVCTTAATLHDSYCALAWGSKLSKEAGAPVAAAVLGDTAHADLTARDRALMGWTRQVVRDPNGTSPDSVAALRAAGLSDAEIFAATVYIGLRLAFSTVNDALGAAPDEALRDGAPAEVREAVTFGRPASAPTR